MVHRDYRRIVMNIVLLLKTKTVDTYAVYKDFKRGVLIIVCGDLYAGDFELRRPRKTCVALCKKIVMYSILCCVYAPGAEISSETFIFHRRRRRGRRRRQARAPRQIPDRYRYGRFVRTAVYLVAYARPVVRPVFPLTGKLLYNTGGTAPARFTRLTWTHH